MPKKVAKMGANLLDMVYLINESEVKAEMGEAFASIMVNPTVVWAKFILTDDMRNGNGQRIPKEEFANLMKSGIHMPVKMAKGEIARGHDGSEPLGSITHLKEIQMPDGSSAIVALAALWGEERPADVTFIRQRFAEQNPVDISWEILYEDASYNEELNSIDLFGTVLRAATFVGDPAYQGRTRVLSVAAKRWSKAYVAELPDSSFLYTNGEVRLFPIVDDSGKIDRTRLKDAVAELKSSELPEEVKTQKAELIEGLIRRFEEGASIEEVTSLFVSNPDYTEEELKTLEELQALVAELEPKVEQLQQALNEAIQTKASLETEVTDLREKLTAHDEELASLREYKASIDAEVEKQDRLEKIKNTFVEAGIQKDEEYFTMNAEKFLKMDEDSLAFMVQEIAANISTTEEDKNTSEASKKTKIPNLTGAEEEVDYKDPKVLGRLLRTRQK